MREFVHRNAVAAQALVLLAILSGCTQAASSDTGTRLSAPDAEPMTADAADAAPEEPDARPRDADPLDSGVHRDAYDPEAEDGGGLPPGFSSECFLMEVEGCYSEFDGCQYGAPVGRLEQQIVDEMAICRCPNWPFSYWQRGDGYHARCRGQAENRCRAPSDARGVCDPGLECAGSVGVSSSGVSLQRTVCWRPCVTARTECAEVDTVARCCRPAEADVFLCQRGGEGPEATACVYSLVAMRTCTFDLPRCP